MDMLNGIHAISRSAANRYGRILRRSAQDAVSASELNDAIRGAQLWRDQHITPTQNCFRAVLDECTDSFPQPVCTYRLKRLVSIIRKLQRTRTHLHLGELDDIGGCRLIVDTIEEAREIWVKLRERLDIKSSKGEKNYIAQPNVSGYRSHHLLTKNVVNNQSYYVEVQIRTKLQHFWSTAVEAVGEIYGMEYKSPEVRAHISGEDSERIEFFRIVSSLFALEEDSALVPGREGSYADLCSRLRSLSCSQRLIKDLESSTDDVCKVNAEVAEGDTFFLLSFSREEQILNVMSFPDWDIDEALNAYSNLEEDSTVLQMHGGLNSEMDMDTNGVLVHAQDFTQISIAYPNYSANMREFVDRAKDYLRMEI
ncbi:hypothetical protein B9G54_06175 [Alloscardovia macacae]|uniref:RelA/SpoT domain-containing protein n=1 Tax=Alloscardovia macacae TaxID=1160091 RepID=A0A1Y2T059_9BIFI|nr:RelA/SpoT domain-containing protein [Alloscardovia macacae]OTA26040.1 hypothetical protein B9G54_06175 [Alloscardovia macacae]OTA29898.1 hypothetical protein B9T39_02155 [Alloscardovia macacae]